VSITGLGVHLPVAMTTPVGITSAPYTTLTAAVPDPVTKKRRVGFAASTQVWGDCPEEPAGKESESAPNVPVAAKVSLPATRLAPPLSVQGELVKSEFSKSPPGASSYEASSPHGANGWLTAAELQGVRLIRAAPATEAEQPSETAAPSAQPTEAVPRILRAELTKDPSSDALGAGVSGYPPSPSGGHATRMHGVYRHFAREL
jgi:hypothetical protein